jgi:hypothetical protein
VIADEGSTPPRVSSQTGGAVGCGLGRVTSDAGELAWLRRCGHTWLMRAAPARPCEWRLRRYPCEWCPMQELRRSPQPEPTTSPNAVTDGGGGPTCGSQVAAVISSPDLGVFAVAAAGVLCAFCCLADALPEHCLRRRPRANLLVAAVFRTKRLLPEPCSVTCQRRRRPGQARRRRGGLQITAAMRGYRSPPGPPESSQNGTFWRWLAWRNSTSLFTGGDRLGLVPMSAGQI